MNSGGERKEQIALEKLKQSHDLARSMHHRGIKKD